MRAQLKVPGGGLVQSDAGNLQFVGTSNENGGFDFEILKDAGHHEQFQSDVFCNAALPFSAYRRRHLSQPPRTPPRSARVSGGRPFYRLEA